MLLCLIWLICYQSFGITCLYQTVPVIRISVDQSLHSRPDRIDTVRPVPSIIVRGSWRLSVEHCRSNSTRRPLAPSKENHFQLTRSLRVLLRKQTYQLHCCICISYTDSYRNANIQSELKYMTDCNKSKKVRDKTVNTNTLCTRSGNDGHFFIRYYVIL